MSRHDKRVVVYALTDVGDQVIYVGCTQDLRQRLKAHRSTSPWFDEVAGVRRTMFPTRATGLRRESELILSLQPRHNKNGKTPKPSRSAVKEQSLTPKGILLDMRLRDAGHPGLLDYIAAQRGSGATWSTIAADIEAVTGLRVTDMGVRYWMDKAQGAAA